LRLGI
jgi:hypothetical protein